MNWLRNIFKKEQASLKEVVDIIPENELGYCIFTWQKIHFDVNRPYVWTNWISDRGNYCHFTWEKWEFWESSIPKPIFYKNYVHAIEKFWKENCIPLEVRDSGCFEPNIWTDYYQTFKSVVYEAKKTEIKAIVEKFVSDIRDGKEKDFLIKRAIADIMRHIDNNYLWLNEKFSFFKAVNEGYEFKWFYKYCIRILYQILENKIDSLEK